MKPAKRKKPEASPSIPIAPMVDCVFLLLVYFMVSTSLDREEAPLPVSLPGQGSAESLDHLPEEQLVRIREDGRIEMNEMAYDSPESRDLPELVSVLAQFREYCAADGIEPMILIAPEAETPHQRIVDLLDGLSRAGLERIQFVAE